MTGLSHHLARESSSESDGEPKVNLCVPASLTLALSALDVQNLCMRSSFRLQQRWFKHVEIVQKPIFFWLCRECKICCLLFWALSSMAHTKEPPKLQALQRIFDEERAKEVIPLMESYLKALKREKKTETQLGNLENALEYVKEIVLS